MFDEETERYVRAFQRYATTSRSDGIVGDETWNVLHGNADNLDPHGDGRQPHTYVEENPRAWSGRTTATTTSSATRTPTSP